MAYVSEVPHLVEEWHPTKNGSVKPSDLTIGIKRKTWWLGACGHEWTASIRNRANGSGCPVCKGILLVVGVNDFESAYPEIANQWHPTKNGDLKPTEITYGSCKKVWWRVWHGKCGMWHEWKTTPAARSKGKVDPFTVGHKVLVGCNDLATTHPSLASEWHPTKNGDLKPTEITYGSCKKVWWRVWHDECGMWHEWDAVVGSRSERIGGTGDPIVNGAMVLSGCNDLATTHPWLLPEWHSTKNDISPQKISFGTKTSV